MDLHTIVALVLSGAIGVSLGLLGGGGSILAVRARRRAFLNGAAFAIS